MSRILVVDDERQVRNWMSTFLQRDGHSTVGAKSGEEALGLLTTDQFDLVILDIVMPGIGGRVVLDRLQEWVSPVPTVCVTGYGSIKGGVDAIRAGARDYLAKPFGSDELIAAANRALGREDGIGKAVRGKTSTLVKRAVEVINEDFASPTLSTATISKQLNVRTEHLCRRFKQEMGHGVLVHLHTTRILEAQQRLRNTTDSVKVIAIDCGYRTTGRLDVYFKRLVGLTPNEFRGTDFS